jgi:hypothetical protein
VLPVLPEQDRQQNWPGAAARAARGTAQAVAPQFEPVTATASDQATANSRPDKRNLVFAASHHWALFFFLSFGLAVITRISWRARSSPDASGQAFASIASQSSKRGVSMSTVLPRWYSSPLLACSGMTPPRIICSQNGSKSQSLWGRRNRLPVSGARTIAEIAPAWSARRSLPTVKCCLFQ